MMLSFKKKRGSSPRQAQESSVRKQKNTNPVASLTYTDYVLVVDENGRKKYVSPSEAAAMALASVPPKPSQGILRKSDPEEPRDSFKSAIGSSGGTHYESPISTLEPTPSETPERSKQPVRPLTCSELSLASIPNVSKTEKVSGWLQEQEDLPVSATKEIHGVTDLSWIDDKRPPLPPNPPPRRSAPVTVPLSSPKEIKHEEVKNDEPETTSESSKSSKRRKSRRTLSENAGKKSLKKKGVFGGIFASGRKGRSVTRLDIELAKNEADSDSDSSSSKSEKRKNPKIKQSGETQSKKNFLSSLFGSKKKRTVRRSSSQPIGDREVRKSAESVKDSFSVGDDKPQIEGRVFSKKMKEKFGSDGEINAVKGTKHRFFPLFKSKSSEISKSKKSREVLNKETGVSDSELCRTEKKYVDASKSIVYDKEDMGAFPVATSSRKSSSSSDTSNERRGVVSDGEIEKGDIKQAKRIKRQFSFPWRFREKKGPKNKAKEGQKSYVKPQTGQIRYSSALDDDENPANFIVVDNSNIKSDPEEDAVRSPYLSSFLSIFPGFKNNKKNPEKGEKSFVRGESVDSEMDYYYKKEETPPSTDRPREDLNDIERKLIDDRDHDKKDSEDSSDNGEDIDIDEIKNIVNDIYRSADEEDSDKGRKKLKKKLFGNKNSKSAENLGKKKDQNVYVVNAINLVASSDEDVDLNTRKLKQQRSFNETETSSESEDEGVKERGKVTQKKPKKRPLKSMFGARGNYRKSADGEILEANSTDKPRMSIIGVFGSKEKVQPARSNKKSKPKNLKSRQTAQRKKTLLAMFGSKPKVDPRDPSGDEMERNSNKEVKTLKESDSSSSSSEDESDKVIPVIPQEDEALPPLPLSKVPSSSSDDDKLSAIVVKPEDLNKVNILKASQENIDSFSSASASQDEGIKNHAPLKIEADSGIAEPAQNIPWIHESSGTEDPVLKHSTDSNDNSEQVKPETGGKPKTGFLALFGSKEGIEPATRKNLNTQESTKKQKTGFFSFFEDNDKEPRGGPKKNIKIKTDHEKQKKVASGDSKGNLLGFFRSKDVKSEKNVSVQKNVPVKRSREHSISSSSSSDEEDGVKEIRNDSAKRAKVSVESPKKNFLRIFASKGKEKNESAVDKDDIPEKMESDDVNSDKSKKNFFGMFGSKDKLEAEQLKKQRIADKAANKDKPKKGILAMFGSNEKVKTNKLDNGEIEETDSDSEEDIKKIEQKQKQSNFKPILAIFGTSKKVPRKETITVYNGNRKSSTSSEESVEKDDTLQGSNTEDVVILKNEEFPDENPNIQRIEKNKENIKPTGFLPSLFGPKKTKDYSKFLRQKNAVNVRTNSSDSSADGKVRKNGKERVTVRLFQTRDKKIMNNRRGFYEFSNSLNELEPRSPGKSDFFPYFLPRETDGDVESCSSSSTSLIIPQPVGIWGPKRKSHESGGTLRPPKEEPIVLMSWKQFDDNGNEVRVLPLPEPKKRPSSLPLHEDRKKPRPLSLYAHQLSMSDTESADHGSTDKSSISKLTQDRSSKPKFTFLGLLKKPKDKVTDIDDGKVVAETKNNELGSVDGLGRTNGDGVVYAELDIVRTAENPLRAPAEAEKTEYAEIIHPNPRNAKKEDLRKSRENLAGSREALNDPDVTTTPDGKKEAAV